jgi:hypothetical protein
MDDSKLRTGEYDPLFQAADIAAKAGYAVRVDSPQISGNENFGHGPGVRGRDFQAPKNIPAKINERFRPNNFVFGIHRHPFRRVIFPPRPVPKLYF